MSIQTYIDTCLAIYDKRNGGINNPISIYKTIDGNIFRTIVSIREPSFSGIPINVLWINIDTQSPLNQKVLRRTSKFPDETNLTRNTWVPVEDEDQLYAEIQTYNIEGSLLLGELLAGMQLPSASKNTSGLVKLTTMSGTEAIAVGDNDPRMTDNRAPTAHTHALEPVEQFKAFGGATNINTGSAPIAGQCLTISANGDAIWRFLTQADVFVPPTNLINLTITGPDTAFETDTNIQFSARAFYDNNSSQLVTPVWSSSDVSIATISASGQVTIQSITTNSSVSITATYTANGVTKTATKTLSITNVSLLTGLSILGQSTIAEGSKATYTASAIFDDGTTSAVNPTWSLSNITPGASITVNASGEVNVTSTPASFTLTLTATYTLAGITKTATKSINIADVPVTLESITINGADSLYEGATSAYTVTAHYSNATTAIKNTGILWSMTTGTYATIGTNGVVRGLDVSQDEVDQVNASYTENGVTRTVTKNITIRNNVPTGFVISGQSTVNEKETATFTATLTYSNGTTANVSSSTTFTSNEGTFNGNVFTAQEVTTDTTVTVIATYALDGVTYSDTRNIIVTNVIEPLYIKYGEGDYGINSEAGIKALANQLTSNASGQQITLNLTKYGYFAIPSTISGAQDVTFTEVLTGGLLGNTGGWDGANWPDGDIGTVYGPKAINVDYNGSPITWYLYRTDFSGLGQVTMKVTWGV